MSILKTRIAAATTFVSALGLRPIWSTKNTEGQPATLGKEAEEILNGNFSALEEEVGKKADEIKVIDGKLLSVVRNESGSIPDIDLSPYAKTTTPAGTVVYTPDGTIPQGVTPDDLNNSTKPIIDFQGSVEELLLTTINYTTTSNVLGSTFATNNQILKADGTYQTTPGATILHWKFLPIDQGVNKISRLDFTFVRFGGSTDLCNLIGIRDDGTITPIIRGTSTPATGVAENQIVDVSNYKYVTICHTGSEASKGKLDLKVYAKSSVDTNNVKTYVDLKSSPIESFLNIPIFSDPVLYATVTGDTTDQLGGQSFLNQFLQTNNTLISSGAALIKTWLNVPTKIGNEIMTKCVFHIIRYGGDISKEVRNANFIGIRSDGTIDKVVQAIAYEATQEKEVITIDTSEYVSISFSMSKNNPTALAYNKLEIYTGHIEKYVNEDVKEYIDDTLKNAGIDTQKTNPFYNVKYWGAKGDGITDDQPAIQAAMDYVVDNGGGTLFFPNGIYKLVTVIERYNCKAHLIVKPRGGSVSDIDRGNRTMLRLLGEGMVNTSGGYANHTGSINETVQLERGAILASDIIGDLYTDPSTKHTSVLACGGKTIGSYIMNPGLVDLKDIAIRVHVEPNKYPRLSGIDMAYAASVYTDNVLVYPSLTNYQQTAPSIDGHYSCGFIAPILNCNPEQNFTNLYVKAGFRYGILMSEHAFGNNISVWCCENAFVFSFMFHPAYFGRVHSQNCKNILSALDVNVFGHTVGNSYIDISQVGIEANIAQTPLDFNHDKFINDPSNRLKGKITYHIVKSNEGVNNGLFSKIGGTGLVGTTLL